MNVNTLITNLAVAVAQDSDILTWANTNYGQDHYVFVNFDVQDPPGEDYCPYVMIAPDRKRMGQRISQREHAVDVVCCIHDDASRTHAGISNIIEYQGVSNLETFRKYVETAVVGVSVGNGAFDFEVEYDTISTFPLMWCFMRATVPEPVTIGSDYLA